MVNFCTPNFLKTALAVTLWFSLGSAAFAQSGLQSVSGTVQPLGLNLKFQPGSQARTSALISRPGNSQDFSALPNGSWTLESNSVYTYDGSGRLTQRLFLHPSTAANLQRQQIVYDPQGNETENRTETWVNNNWEITEGYKALVTYNPAGKATETIYQVYNSSNSQWENMGREQITYDAAGLATEITNSEWLTNQWSLTDRALITSPNGPASALLIQTHNGSTWEDDSRASNVTWRVLYEEPSAYVLEVFDNNTWIKDEKYNAIYNSNGGHVGIYQTWDAGTATWENSFRETESIDQNLNFTGWLNEGWNPLSNVWYPMGENQELLTYNSIDVVQRIFRDNNNPGSIMTDRSKEVYSNFQTFNVSGLKDLLAEAAVNLYPNPANSFVHVTLPPVAGELTASLTDVTGKQLVTQQYKGATAFELSLESLPKGVYLLKLQSGNATAVKKIIKQ